MSVRCPKSVKYYIYSYIMSDPGIGTYVRYWLHYSTLASSLYKQFCSAKKVQDDYGEKIINTLQQKGLENAIIQINGGQLSVAQKRQPNQLSLSKIQELLHSYFKHRGGKDETMDIMTFVKGNRGYSIQKFVKKTGTGGKSEQQLQLPQSPL